MEDCRKKWTLPLWISLVNMTKSAVVTITKEIRNGKLHFTAAKDRLWNLYFAGVGVLRFWLLIFFSYYYQVLMKVSSCCFHLVMLDFQSSLLLQTDVMPTYGFVVIVQLPQISLVLKYFPSCLWNVCHWIYFLKLSCFSSAQPGYIFGFCNFCRYMLRR